ncbi:HEAT repeat domain-containing protein [Neorhodopirellula lusitana]|uniref:HEAT repeat domain-containing protein n=1 Tax=Neorhodopirellula lusitana TaxID=445327 RepID=UPI00384B3BD6
MQKLDRIWNASRPFGCAILLSVLGSHWVVAGKVELSGGGQLTGDVRRVEDANGKTAHVIVRVDPDMSIAVAGTHTRRTVEADQLVEYRSKAAAAGQDAEAQFELARWCKSKTLLNQYHFHLVRTIELDPDHRLARAALGYVKSGNEWISFEKLRRSQGLVQDGKGRWVLPEVLSVRQYSDEAERASKLWIKNFRRLHSRAIRGDAEALAEINAIDDPMATNAIAGEFLRSRSSRANLRTLRMTYVRLLAKFRNQTAVSTLVEAGLNETDAIVREEALRQLVEYGGSSAVASYLPLLRSNSPAQVKAAARALEYFPNAELAFEYVRALITEQKTRTQMGSGGTDASFGNNGVNGLTQGSKVVERTTQIRHPEVLQLVKTIAPGVDYGFDENAWRRYFASLRNPPRSDLRRDP